MYKAESRSKQVPGLGWLALVHQQDLVGFTYNNPSFLLSSALIAPKPPTLD
jgi:hypothetical protein